MTARTPSMSQLGSSGNWWRFSRYELRDGYVRPAPGAKLEPYDPWASYRQARVSGKLEPPYRSLLALLDRLKADSGQPALNSLTRGALLDWCADHGLLGVLPHRAQMMILAPHWVRPDAVAAEMVVPGVRPRTLREPEPIDWDHYADIDPADLELPQFVKPAAVVQLRVGNQWRSILATWPGAPVSETDEVGQTIPADLQPRGWPKVILGNLRDALLAEMPLAEGVGRFFPDVPAQEKQTYRYPLPLTEAFWQQYAEPIEDFWAAAVAFRDAADGIALVKHGRSGVRLTPARRAKVSAALAILNALTAPVRTALEVDAKGVLCQRWAAGSLLASFALMLQQDADEGWRVVRCESCGRVFTTHDTRVRYCSERCRWRLVKRAERARAKH